MKEVSFRDVTKSGKVCIYMDMEGLTSEQENKMKERFEDFVNSIKKELGE